MKKVLSPLKNYKKQLIIGPIFKLLEAILELLIPTLMVYIIDVGITNQDTGYIIKMGLLMLGIAAVGLCSALVCQYSASVAPKATEPFCGIGSFSTLPVSPTGNWISWALPL